jgi:SAM-dependent methyltransferase
VLDQVWTGAAPSRALDLGAGTGAVGRVLRERFGGALELVAVDRTPAPGVLRADLGAALPPVEGRFDLVVAAHLLNELFAGQPEAQQLERRAGRVLAWARALLAPGGLLVLIEPALRETSRALLAVRDRVVAAGLQVVAPCFRQGACPALASPRDWCHDAAPTDRGRVDFSFLVLRVEPVGRAPALHRVVSDALAEKGRLRLFVCGAAGRHELVRLSRHRAQQNAALDRVARGAVLSIENAEAAGPGLRVTPETTIAVPAAAR